MSTLTIYVAGKWPILGPRRDLSRTRICDSKIVDPDFKPAVPFGRKTFGGYSLTKCFVVNGAAMTVGANALPMSFWIIKTGLRPACSEPLAGSRSIQKISPRLIINVF